MHSLTRAQLTTLLAQCEMSSPSQSKHLLARIARHNPLLICFVTVTEELALQAAQQADQRRQQGKAGPLTGIPLAHKDIFCTEGVRTSCGSRMLENFIAPYESTVTA